MDTNIFSSKIKIKEDEWICPYCENINNSYPQYCVSCGKLQPNKLLLRVPFFIFTIILFLSFGFWIYKYIYSQQYIEYSKLIAMFFIFAIPLLLLSVGSLVFVIEFFKTVELRENPNKLLHSNPQMRIEAVKHLENNDDLLLKLLNSEKNSAVKEEIVVKIKDINILKKIALKDKDENVRKKAISVIYDEIIMMEILSKEPIAELRKEALKKVTTQKYLIETAINDSDSNVRQEAIKKIIDQNALIEIASNEKEIVVRQEALNKIANKAIVNEILKKSNNKELNIFITNLNKITSLSVFEKELKNKVLPFVNPHLHHPPIEKW